MIQFSVDDFVIVSKQNTNKKELVQIVQKLKNKVYGIREKQRSDDHVEHIEIEPEDIFANLGKNPAIGSVYGNSTEIFKNKKEMDNWGIIKFFRSLDKTERLALKSALKICIKKFEKLQITLPKFETEIRESRGKTAGMYYHRTKKNSLGDVLDLIVLKPKDFVDLVPLIFHELGHAIWYRRISPKTKTRWILAYQRSITLQKVSTKSIHEVISGFIESKLLCKAYTKTLTEEYVDIFKMCLDYADDKHRLTKNHLDLLILDDRDLTKYFSIEDIKLQNIELVLTEYAKESVEEFFAEAISLHLSGKILPKSLNSLVELTLTNASHYIEETEE